MPQPQRLRSLSLTISRLRNWFAWNLGVSAARKEFVYLDIAQAVTLTDTSYWLQVLFAAGIATLGLVLNSPAVIIGAMLISPLMGSILANGLALAAGDVILALRAMCNLILSCGLAIGFAVLLVSMLPFKEMTSEILARTQPTLLDLGVALFSGAVGAIAICKEAKGIATSIPGVSIAVALMPPLCVVGYGIGIAVSVNARTGLQVAQGGGLLFFTNFVAITFSAMLVFLALNIDIESVRERVREWRLSDRESKWVRQLLDQVPASDQFRHIGSLPGRLLLILTTIVLISIPLNQSFIQLRNEITYKQQENRLRNAATEVWQKNLAMLPDGKARSYISQLAIKGQRDKLAIQLQVITNQVYTEAERERYKQLLAQKLSRPVESISLNLVEIPTASFEPSRSVSEEQISLPSSILELQANLLREINTALSALQLPAPAQWVGYAAITRPDTPLKIEIFYLSQRDIDRDGQALLVQTIRTRLNVPTAQVMLERIVPIAETISFAPNQATLAPNQTQKLDAIAQLLQQYPTLALEGVVNQTPTETGTLSQERAQTILTYLQTQGKIPPERLTVNTATAPSAIAELKTVVKSTPVLQDSSKRGGVR
jgi:uncharacterized hydrophobic protein (TIGR00271 family)